MTARDAWERLAVFMAGKHGEPFADLFPFADADLRDYGGDSYAFHYSDATFFVGPGHVVEYRHVNPPIERHELVERAWNWQGKRITMPALPWEAPGQN